MPGDTTLTLVIELQNRAQAQAEALAGQLQGVQKQADTLAQTKIEFQTAQSQTAITGLQTRVDTLQRQLGTLADTNPDIKVKDNFPAVEAQLGTLQTVLTDLKEKPVTIETRADTASVRADLAEINRQMAALKADATTIPVRVDTAGATPAIAQVKNELAATGKTAEETGVTASGAFNRMRDAAAGFLAAAVVQRVVQGIGTAIGDLVGQASNFQAQMSKIQATSGATDAQLGSLRQTAIDLGMANDVGAVSAADAANAEFELGKAGVDIATINDGAAKATLQLAAAAGPEFGVANSASLASDAMNTFGLSGKALTGIVDNLVGAANASTIGLSDLKFSLSAVGPVAHQVGMTLGDFDTAIAEMGAHGLKGADAGTSLKTMLLNLVPSTKAAHTEMLQLGLVTKDGANHFFDATGKVKDLAQVQGLLQAALRGLTPVQQEVALKTMFGTDAVRASAIMAGEGAAGATKMAAAIKLQGDAAGASATMNNNLQGKWETLKGTVDTIAISLGTNLLPALSGITDGINDLAGTVLGAINGTQTWGQVWGDVTTSIGSALPAIQPLTDFLRDNLNAVLLGIGAALTAVVVPAVLAAIPAFIALAVPVIAAAAPFIALGVAVAALVALWNDDFAGMQEAVHSAWDTIQPVLDAILGGIQTVADAFGSGGLQGALDALPGALEPILQALAQFGQQLQQAAGVWAGYLMQWALDAIPGLLSNLATLGGQVFGWITTIAIPGVFNAVTGLVGAVLSWIAPAANQAPSQMDALGQNIQNWVNDVLPQVWNWFQVIGVRLIGAIAKGIQQSAPDLLSGLEGFLNGAISKINEVFHTDLKPVHLQDAINFNEASIALEQYHMHAKVVAAETTQYQAQWAASYTDSYGQVGNAATQLRNTQAAQAEAAYGASTKTAQAAQAGAAGIIAAAGAGDAAVGGAADKAGKVHAPKHVKAAADTGKAWEQAMQQIVNAVGSAAKDSEGPSASVAKSLSDVLALAREKVPKDAAWIQASVNQMLAAYKGGTETVAQVNAGMRDILTRLSHDPNVDLSLLAQSQLDALTKMETQAGEKAQKIADKLTAEQAKAEQSVVASLGKMVEAAGKQGTSIGDQWVSALDLVKSATDAHMPAIATSIQQWLNTAEAGGIQSVQGLHDQALALLKDLAANGDAVTKAWAQAQIADIQAAADAAAAKLAGLQQTLAGGFSGVVKDFATETPKLGATMKDMLTLAQKATDAGMGDIAATLKTDATAIWQGQAGAWDKGKTDVIAILQQMRQSTDAITAANAQEMLDNYQAGWDAIAAAEQKAQDARQAAFQKGADEQIAAANKLATDKVAAERAAADAIAQALTAQVQAQQGLATGLAGVGADILNGKDSVLQALIALGPLAKTAADAGFSGVADTIKGWMAQAAQGGAVSMQDMLAQIQAALGQLADAADPMTALWARQQQQLLANAAAAQAYTAAIQGQTAVVGQYQAALTAAQGAEKAAQDRVTALGAAYQDAQTKLNDFKSAQLAGTQAADDKNNVNKQQQSAIQLAMDDLKAAGGDTAKARETLAGQIASLKAEHATNEKALQDQIAGTTDSTTKKQLQDALAAMQASDQGAEGQLQQAMDSLNSGNAVDAMKALQDQLTALQTQASQMQNLGALTFDPMKQAIDRAASSTKELDFTHIIQGVGTARDRMATLEPAIAAANRALAAQQQAVAAATAALADQQAKLQALQQAQQAAQQGTAATGAAFSALGTAITTTTSAALDPLAGQFAAALSASADAVTKAGDPHQAGAIAAAWFGEKGLLPELGARVGTTGMSTGGAFSFVPNVITAFKGLVNQGIPDAIDDNMGAVQSDWAGYMNAMKQAALDAVAAIKQAWASVPAAVAAGSGAGTAPAAGTNAVQTNAVAVSNAVLAARAALPSAQAVPPPLPPIRFAPTLLVSVNGGPYQAQAAASVRIADLSSQLEWERENRRG